MSGLDERAAIVAGKLSEAQRRSILASQLPETDHRSCYMLFKLQHLGLLDVGFHLNDLGLAVRDHLANPTPGVTKE